ELEYSAEIVAATRADPLVGEEASAKLKLITSLTREPHALEGRITTLIANGGLFAAIGSAPFDPASDRIMLWRSVPVLTDLKQIALAAGFVEGANHEPGTFVVERAFAG